MNTCDKNFKDIHIRLYSDTQKKIDELIKIEQEEKKTKSLKTVSISSVARNAIDNYYNSKKD